MHETIISAICEQFSEVSMNQFRGETRFVVPSGRLHVFLEELKTRHGFDMLVDVTCVDYLEYPDTEKGDTEKGTGTFCTTGCPDTEKGDTEKGTGTFCTKRSQSPFPVPFFDRFGLVYVLADTVSNRRVVVRTFVGEDEPSVPTVFDLWRSADWLEREVWDLFGIQFEGHPDLRRIVLPEEFESHPLRKDYPLQGLGERHNLPVISRKES